jgi:hypothetical protein
MAFEHRSSQRAHFVNISNVSRSHLRPPEMRKALYVTVAIIFAFLAYQAWRRSSVPPIARDLPSNIAAAEIEFKERLKSRYLVGTTDSDLVRDLQAQGFRPPVSYRDRKYATFCTTSIPCKLTWTVVWHVDQESKVHDVDGSYSATCP